MQCIGSMKTKVYINSKLVLKQNIGYFLAGETVEVVAIQSKTIWLRGTNGSAQVHPRMLLNAVKEIL